MTHSADPSRRSAIGSVKNLYQVAGVGQVYNLESQVPTMNIFQRMARQSCLYATLATITLLLLGSSECSRTYASGVEPQSPAAASRSTPLWITAWGKNGPVNDLRKDEVKVFIGKNQVPVQDLSFNPPMPLNLGFIVDISGSLPVGLPEGAADLAPDFFRKLHVEPGDQIFVVAFNEKGYLLTNLTDNEQILNTSSQRIRAFPRHGGTALFDALFFACDQKSNSVGKHRALVVTTDGKDDASRHTFDQVARIVRKTGTVLFFIAPDDDDQPPGTPVPSHRGTETLQSLGDSSGGGLFKVSDKTQESEALTAIAQALRCQYLLDFQVPGGQSKSNTRLKLKCSRRGVKMIAPKELP